MAYRIARLTVEDLPQVAEIEQEAFPTPWPLEAYARELTDNKLAHYLALYDDGARPPIVAGYAGLWLVFDEVHLTTIAVRDRYRGRGLSEALLTAALDLAVERGAEAMTLEVRVSNRPAQKLYEKYGFEYVGRRPNYYPETHEDALLMTVHGIATPAYQRRLAELKSALRRRVAIVGAG